MTVFSANFRSYYLSPCVHTYSAWKPNPQQVVKQVKNRQINIEESAERHKVSSQVQDQIDTLITSEVHAKLVDNRFDGDFFKSRGFTVLKDGTTRVVEHPSLPGFLIKTAIAERSFWYHTVPDSEQFTIKHTNLLRAEGHDYYSQQSQDDFFTLPSEYLYESPHADHTKPLQQRFYSISQKMDVYSPEESLNLVRSLNREEQLRIAQKVCDLIQHTGLTDMHSGNLVIVRGLKNWKFAILDQEPLNLFTENSDKTTSLMTKKDRALLGMLYFRDTYCREHGLNEMAHYVDQEIQDKLDAQEVGKLHDSYYRADNMTVIKILITIPFFFIILPVLALHAACANPQRCYSDNQEVLPIVTIVVGALAAVAAVFILLSVYQIFPHMSNVISNLGIGGKALGYYMGAASVLTAVGGSGVLLFSRSQTKNKQDPLLVNYNYQFA